MKRTTLFVLLLSIFATSYAAVLFMIYNDSEHPGKCVITPDLILSPGMHKKHPNAKCVRIVCEGDGVNEFHSCDTPLVPTGCKLGNFKNIGADYPDCCDREIEC